jgi:hypothetical protein
MISDFRPETVIEQGGFSNPPHSHHGDRLRGRGIEAIKNRIDLPLPSEKKAGSRIIARLIKGFFTAVLNSSPY